MSSRASTQQGERGKQSTATPPPALLRARFKTDEKQNEKEEATAITSAAAAAPPSSQQKQRGAVQPPHSSASSIRPQLHHNTHSLLHRQHQQQQQQQRRHSSVTSSSTPQGGSASANSRWVKSHVLEGDGLVAQLYAYMFRMQKALRNTSTEFASSSSGAAPSSLPPTATAAGGGGGTATTSSKSNSNKPPPFPTPTAPSRGGAQKDGPNSPHRKTLAHLGNSSSSTGASNSNNSSCCFALPIPDTVVFDHNFPQAWFSYNLKHREIVKRAGKYLDAVQIYKSFSTVSPGCGDVCAQFVEHKVNVLSGESTCRVSYLSPSELEEWLYNRGSKANVSKEGILQKFVAPRQDCNDTMQVVWSQRLTVVQRRVNIHRQASRHVDRLSKCATYDGPPHLSTESLANEGLHDQITQMIQCMADYLLRAEHKIVSRMVAIVKQDATGQLWFLHCTSLRVEGDKLIAGSTTQRLPLDLNPRYVHPGTEVSDDTIDEAMENEAEFLSPRRESATAHITLPRDPAATLLQRRQSKSLTQVTTQKAKQERRAYDILSGTASTSSSSAATPLSSMLCLSPEMQSLVAYIDETLYGLYSSRSTAASGEPLRVSLPSHLYNYLGAEDAQYLMCSVLGLRRLQREELEEEGIIVGTVVGSGKQQQQHHVYETVCVPLVSSASDDDGPPRSSASPATMAPASGFVLSDQRPLCTIRQLCDEFVERLKEVRG